MTRMAILTGVLLFLAGCVVPPNAPQWLPDSSGLIYTTNTAVVPSQDVLDDDNFHYSAVHWHISENGVRETPIASGRGKPSLSPDGKQLAFATIHGTPDGLRIEVHIYDLSGNEIHRSKPFLDPRLGTRADWGDVVWSPNGRFLLISPSVVGPKQEGGTLETLAYDTRANTFKLFEGVTAGLIMDDILGCSPCSGDGRGFLAARMTKDPPKGELFEELLFVEWQGQQHSLKMAPQADRSVWDLWTKTCTDLSGELEGPLPKARWNGATLVLVIRDGYVRVDTKNCLVTYEHDVNVAKQRQDLMRNRVYDAVSVGDGKCVLQCVVVSRTKMSVDFLLQVVNTETGNTKILDAGSTMLYLQKMLFLSPNKKYVAAICPAAREDSLALYVVDENGDVLLQWPGTRDSDQRRSERIERAKSELAASQN